MPDIIANDNDIMNNLQTSSNYGFSAVGLDALGASEYTLVTIAVDQSGSVSGMERQFEDCIKSILKSCQKSPRSDNLLLRLVEFNNDIREVHGFRLLSNINASEYEGSLSARGTTALFDSVYTAIEATADYAEVLVNQGDMSANAVVYIITDGMDNLSNNTESQIKKLINKIKTDEIMESLAVILIGVVNSGIEDYLKDFRINAEIDQFVDLTTLFENNSPENALAKLAGYVSRSIASTSQSLASGSATPSSSLLTI